MLKSIEQNPTVVDQVLLELVTPNADGCLLENPYKIDSLTIYFIERGFSDSNDNGLIEKYYDAELYAELEAAKKVACQNPTEENLAQVELLQNKLALNTVVEQSYFANARVVYSLGANEYNAWIDDGKPDDYQIKLVPYTQDGLEQFGKFVLIWDANGNREGDYVVSWTWTPYATSPNDKLSSQQRFILYSATNTNASIPTHFTPSNKYELMLDRYMPQVCKMYLTQDDITPEVLQEFNLAVAKGFTFIENISNQLLDLLDANTIPESFLHLLGNMFGLKLRSNDPTLWRRQIKRAVILNKKKGTLTGLTEALAQAGITLKKLTKLWQVVSPYTYQESFIATKGQTTFTLKYSAITPIDENFELYYKANGGIWEQIDISNINITDTILTWVGGELAANDQVRIIYKINEIATPEEQAIEDYIRTLPYLYQPEEASSPYPLPNWNAKALDEDDPMFNVIIPVKNPHHDPLLFGYVRTEFPYSENIYNMEEYNGSIRESHSPKDIDKNFINDKCSGNISSSFKVILEIENITNERLLEAVDIINEFKPFHAQLHSINFLASYNEFVAPPLERINKLIHWAKTDITTVCPVQTIFNRSMDNTVYNEEAHTIKQFLNGELPVINFKRESLANALTFDTISANIYNDKIMLFAPNTYLASFPNLENSELSYLEILTPSLNAGKYQIKEANGYYATVIGTPTEPLDASAFTFRLSKEKIRQTAGATGAAIYQDNIYCFYETDASIDLTACSIKTQQDVESGLSPAPYKIYIPSFSNSFDILESLPNGKLILNNTGLPDVNMSNLAYELRDYNNNTIATGVAGNLYVTKRGRVELGTSTQINGQASIPTANIENITNFVSIGDYLLWTGLGDNQYRICGFVATNPHAFYIENYTAGNVNGQAIIVYERVFNNKTGYFTYQSPYLRTTANYEEELKIQNGANPPAVPLENHFDTTTNKFTSSFKENFLLTLEHSGKLYYYSIAEIDGTKIYLNGPNFNWATTGTTVAVTILQFPKLAASVPERLEPSTPAYDFNWIDRRGQDIITFEIENAEPISMLTLAETFNKDNDQKMDFIQQQEQIQFKVEWGKKK